MLTAVMVTLLAAPGQVAVIRCIQASAERCDDIAGRLRESLRTAGAPLGDEADLTAAARECGTERECLLRRLRASGGSFLVSVDVAQIGDRVAIQLDASTGAGAPLAQSGFTVSAIDYPAGLAGPVGKFVADLLPALRVTPPAELAPAPEAAVSAPPDVPPRRSAAGPALWGVAAALGVAGIVMAGLGADQALSLERAKTTVGGAPASRLTFDMARAHATTANALLTAALVSALLSAAFGTAALIFW